MRRTKQEEAKLRGRVEWCVKNSINWMQPTIPPASKNVERKEIESLKEAMDYYAPYTSTLVLQKKYMGSYCLMYLNKDHSQSYFVSRGGYVIKKIHEQLLEASKWIQEEVIEQDDEWVLVESELMPWRALGDSLIDYEYGNYGALHADRLEYFKSTDIFTKIQRLKNTEPWKQEGLKSHEKRQYESVQDIVIPNIQEYENSIDLYHKQLQEFGSEGEIEFKPFNILKHIKEDGIEYLEEVQNCELFQNDADFLYVDVANYSDAYKFLESHKSKNAEGIMVKPYEQDIINIAPALKVRTNNYLQLIYGVNFDRDFNYYLEKRNIRRKLQQSIEDYEITRQLLNIPRKKLTSQNTKYIQLLYKFFDGEEYAKTFDTRL